MTDLIHLDHTKRSDFVTCPRKYYNRYVRHLQSRNGSPFLRYGVAWHAAMEGFYEEIAAKGWGAMADGIRRGAELAQARWNEESEKFNFNDDDYRNFPNLMQAFVKYLEHYHFDEGILRIIEPEKVFSILIKPNAYEMGLFPGIQPFFFEGQIDLEVELNGRPWIMEQKTTGRPLSLQASTLHRSPQVMGYNYAGRATSLLKEIPDGSLVSLNQITAYKSRTTGRYGDPKFNFTRSPQIFSAEDLANWRLAFMSDVYHLQQCRATAFYPMRHHSCYTYGACTYVGLCEQNRPQTNEILNNLFEDPNPWDVAKRAGDKLVVVEETDPEYWEKLQLGLYA